MSRSLTSFFLAAFIASCLTSSVSAAALVAVGSSSLIDELDYSDTFTLTGTDFNSPDERVAGRAPGADQPFGSNLDMETAYGTNPATSWTFPGPRFRFQADDLPGAAGGSTGFPAGHIEMLADNSFFYGGLRNEFVVQFDGNQVFDRMDIYVSDVPFQDPGAIGGNGIGIFFRNPNLSPFIPGAPEIGVYRPTNGEFESGLVSPIVGPVSESNNYAVRFAPTEIEVFVNEVSLGVVDLTDIDGNGLDWTGYGTDYVGFGSEAVTRFDNFQIGSFAGSIIPEPSAMAIWLVGLGFLGCSKKR